MGRAYCIYLKPISYYAFVFWLALGHTTQRNLCWEHFIFNFYLYDDHILKKYFHNL